MLIQLNSIVHSKMRKHFVNLISKKYFIQNNKKNTKLNLDFGLTYCPNGDLLQYINTAGHFQEDIVRFYAAELIEALEHLQNRQIIHRDLKVDIDESFKTIQKPHSILFSSQKIFSSPMICIFN